ncbi:MAG: citrate synthase [Rhodothermales bacterium]|nr:citrate synthase [Rhodothermales bacterium]
MDTATSAAGSAPAPIYSRGLEGVIALETDLCDIDGQKGELIYVGYEIDDLARHTTFEEVAYLLWHLELPTQAQLDDLNAQLQAARELPDAVYSILRSAPKDADPMAVLQTAVAALGMFAPDVPSTDWDENYRRSIRLTAQIPTIIAAFDRIRKGKEPVAPLTDESTAYNFLYMINGERPGPAAVKIFDAALVLHAEHSLNASTFTARVVGSTLSDIYSSIAAAIGALKGPLHGGANIEVMKMLLDLDETGEDPATWVKERLARKEKIMGFGHRVYKTFDPRATILRETSEDLANEREGQRKWYDYSVAVMETMKTEKNIDPNVDFFSASVYYMLGIDTDLYTPIFALARITGWTAHLLEQWKDNRLIRPSALYTGPRNLTVMPIAERG